jgi:rubrerythrin
MILGEIRRWLNRRKYAKMGIRDADSVSIQVDWAKRNGLRYRVYPCNHVAIPFENVEIPEKCPWCKT